MSTDREATNKAASKRFDDAVNSRDAELIAKTIDELIMRDALIRTPLPIEATRAELAKQGVRASPARLPRPSRRGRGSDRGRGQGRHAQHGHRDPPGRAPRRSTDRQVRHLQRDLHRSLRGRANGPERGGSSMSSRR
jgi:hypothetical protein